MPALAAAAAAISIIAVPGAAGLFGAGLALLMVAISRFDFRYYVIPNELTVTAALLGFANAAVQSGTGVPESIAFAALRGIVVSGAFFVLRMVYKSLRRQEGLGLGDVKLACVAGIWLDWSMIPVAIEIAALAALMAYLVRTIYFNRPLRLKNRVPFGLFFAPAIWLVWLAAFWLPVIAVSR